MFFHHLQTLQLMHDDPSQTEVEQWARLEGKSETMADDLLQTGKAVCRGHASHQIGFCPRCFGCAAAGAAIAIAVERWFCMD